MFLSAAILKSMDFSKEMDYPLRAMVRESVSRQKKKVIGSNGKPSLINIDKSGANTAAIKQFNTENGKRIKIR